MWENNTFECDIHYKYKKVQKLCTILLVNSPWQKQLVMENWKLIHLIVNAIIGSV